MKKIKLIFVLLISPILSFGQNVDFIPSYDKTKTQLEISAFFAGDSLEIIVQNMCKKQFNETFNIYFLGHDIVPQEERPDFHTTFSDSYRLSVLNNKNILLKYRYEFVQFKVAVVDIDKNLSMYKNKYGRLYIEYFNKKKKPKHLYSNIFKIP